MTESRHGFFHLDAPAAGSTLPASRVRFHGWAVGASAVPLADIRARVHSSLFPGSLGFPREDLARHFGLPDPYLPGGFEILADLPPGLISVVFEGCSIEGKWEQLDTIELSVTPAAEPTPTTAPQTLTPVEYERALLFTLRQARLEPVSSAAHRVAQSLPQAQTLRYPHPPFRGHMHRPARLERALFGRMAIEGWLLHDEMEICEIKATVDLQAAQHLTYTLPSPYISSLYPKLPQSTACRYEGWIDVPAQLPRPVSVRLFARLSDGSWHLCVVLQTHPWEGEDEKAPFVPFSRLAFWRAHQALKKSVVERALLPPAGKPGWQALRQAYREFKARAPQCSSPTMLTGTRPVTGMNGASLRRVTLITHNLGLEGAPLFLLELARHLAGRGVSLQVISAQDGPLAASYRQISATVQIVDVNALHQSTSAGGLRREINILSKAVALDGCDLIIANTLATFWGVHLARAAGISSLFYIHESTTPASFYLGHLSPALLPVIEETFTVATHVSFLTESTRAYYRPLLRRDNHSINPGWIILASHDEYLAANPREELRARLALPSATRLVVNMGTICDRKGQHIFIRAVDLLWRRHPALAARCRFLMVGGHDTLFDRAMHELLRTVARPNLEAVPASKNPPAFYGAADLFVCSSYEESFPRVILEAMASRVPIVSTDVHGIPEMVRAEEETILVSRGDSAALCNALVRALNDPASGAVRASHARKRVEAEFDAALLLPRHVDLANSLGPRA